MLSMTRQSTTKKCHKSENISAAKNKIENDDQDYDEDDCNIFRAEESQTCGDDNRLAHLFSFEMREMKLTYRAEIPILLGNFRQSFKSSLRSAHLS